MMAIVFDNPLSKYLRDLREAEEEAKAFVQMLMGEQWTAEECDRLKKRQKEIVMARQMTREERIRDRILLNRNDNTSTALEQSEGYCSAFVDGEMAAEKKVKEINTMQEMTRAEAELKLFQHKVPRDISGKYFTLDILEALGLIKFKPEPDPVNNVVCKEDRQKFKLHMRRRGYTEGSRAFHDALEAYDSTFS